MTRSNSQIKFYESLELFLDIFNPLPVVWTVRLLFYFIFWCGPSLKSLLNMLQYCFCFMFLVFWPQRMWNLSFPTRDRTCTPCIGRWSLNHWTAREVPVCLINNLKYIAQIRPIEYFYWIFFLTVYPHLSIGENLTNYRSHKNSSWKQNYIYIYIYIYTSEIELAISIIFP